MDPRPSTKRFTESGPMNVIDISKGQRGPLSVDPRMDQLEETLRGQEKGRVELLLGMLEQESDEEELRISGQGEIDG
jgi:hypothetical protein